MNESGADKMLHREQGDKGTSGGGGGGGGGSKMTTTTTIPSSGPYPSSTVAPGSRTTGSSSPILFQPDNPNINFNQFQQPGSNNRLRFPSTQISSVRGISNLNRVSSSQQVLLSQQQQQQQQQGSYGSRVDNEGDVSDGNRYMSGQYQQQQQQQQQQQTSSTIPSQQQAERSRQIHQHFVQQQQQQQKFVNIQSNSSNAFTRYDATGIDSDKRSTYDKSMYNSELSNDGNNNNNFNNSNTAMSSGVGIQSNNNLNTRQTNPTNTSSNNTNTNRNTIPRLQFCQWNMIACINCVDPIDRYNPKSEQQQNYDNNNKMGADNIISSINASSKQQFSMIRQYRNTATTDDGGDNQQDDTVIGGGGGGDYGESNGPNSVMHTANNSIMPKAPGPLLLELKHLQYRKPTTRDDDEDINDSDDDFTIPLFSTKTICQSRGNPSFGMSVASTCLDVWKESVTNYSGTEGEKLPLCVTGLTTGALCVHSFVEDTGNETGYGWMSNIDYYHIPRHHRPATAVVWRPETNHAHVAIGLTSVSPSSGLQATSASEHHLLSLQKNSTTTSSNPLTGGSRSSRTIGATALGVATTTAGAVVGAVPGAPTLGRPSTGDRDYCCFLWDVEHQQQQQQQQTIPSDLSSGGIFSRRLRNSTPLYKLSHQTGVASLAWILEGFQTLAVGGQQRNMQLYDLRIGSSSGGAASAGGGTPPVFTIYAHNQGVHGIEVDPHNPWRFLSWSRAPGEVIKLWDARRTDSPLLCEIKVSSSNPAGGGNSNNPIGAGSSIKTMTRRVSESNLSSIPGNDSLFFDPQSISSVKWSQLEKGPISVLMGGNTISDYETSSNPASRPTLISTTHLKKPVVDMLHYPYKSIGNVDADAINVTTEIVTEKRIMSELFAKRMVVIQIDRTVRDVANNRNAPIVISNRDGRLIYGLGRTLWIGSPSVGINAMEQPAFGTDSSSFKADEDISATMMRRGRCINELKYSMDSKSNISLLANECYLTGLSGRNEMYVNQNQLLRLWMWIDRIEGLSVTDNSSKDDTWDEYRGTNFWTSKNLINAGAWALLRFDDGLESEMQQESEALSCTTYDSEGRRAVLTCCGWAGRHDLDNVVAECEELGEYERAAALAVWHGDIGSAVDCLQRGAECIRTQISDTNLRNDPCITFEYAQLLEIISLSIAGYRGGNNNETATSRIWRKSCLSVLQRPELSETKTISNKAAYLRHIMKFLMTIGIDENHIEVLDDNTLSLSDRVAFACRFLSRSSLKTFLENCIVECLHTGNVEGITITGIDKQGIGILQTYVDRVADIQTAALVTSRVVLPLEWYTERRVTAEWLQLYRALLNTWQMWQSRAIFDVDRASLLRKFKQRNAENNILNAGKQGASLHGRRPMSSQKKVRVPDPDVQASVPAQMDARCNYCSVPLGLRKQDNQPNQWLSKMKNVLSCCPNCRKPLPRCAICMLPLGALNPYTELTRSRSARGGMGTDDLSQLASLPFAEWFTWCVRCKHGGHAHHMVGWFAKHNVCPVSGCTCNCQFDATVKLSRPNVASNKTTRNQSSNQTIATTKSEPDNDLQ